MLNSKAAEILRTFTADELKSFRNYIMSPFHNTNKNVVKLFELSRKYAPVYDSPSLSKEKLFKKLYPGKKYSDIVMRILLSDMLFLAKEFLALLRERKYRFGKSLSLLEELKDRGLDSLYLTNYKDTLSILNEVEDIRTKYFNIFELEIVNVDFYLRKDKQQQITPNVLNRVENLIYFMFIEIIRNMHDLVINENTYNSKFEFNLAYEFFKNFNFEPIIEKLKKHRPEHYPVILIYYCLLQALVEEKDEARFDIFKDAFETYSGSLDKDEIAHILRYLDTCCLLRMKHNPAKYRKEIFHVNKQMLEYGVYSYNTDEMTAQKFKNILISAVNLREIDWAEKFVQDYSPKVQEEYRESMLYYGRALTKFLRGDFTGSLADLNKVKSDYIILKMDIRSWTLKIYYELGYYEQALSFIDSYRHFLSKNSSITVHMKERHLSYLKFTNELIKMRSKKDSLSLKKMSDDLSALPNVVHKDWMLEKISELENHR